MNPMSSRAVVNFLAIGFAKLASGPRTNSRTNSRPSSAYRSTLRRTTLRALLLPWMAIAPAAWAVGPTVTTLAISATSVPYKTPITLTATVTTAGLPVTSGFVLFCDASAPVCENNSALALVQLTSPAATATLKLGSGPLGVHSYKAIYRSNTLFNSSTSNTVSYSVVGTYASTTVVSSTGSVGNYTLTGTVAGVGSVLTGPSGNVSFLDASAGNNLLGTQALGSSTLSTTFQAAPGSPFAIATATTTRRSVAIASAYLNADNNLDVVTGDAQQTITVLMGNGDGTFQPKVNYAGCPSGKALKILLADFNRDGYSDVALGCSDGTNGSLTILLGSVDGTFGAPTSYAAGDVAGIAIGDFNRDGIFDIVVSNKQQQNIMLFTGNGNGTFAAGTTVLSPPAALHDVVVADFKADGKDDLLYAINTSVSGSPLSDLYIATGNGDGTFNTPVLIASQVGEFLAAGDTNGDNFPDVISTTITGTPPNVGPSLFVIIGKGDGTFQPKVTYTSDIPSDPHLADVNGDGKPDIIAGGSYGELVYEGNGDGTFKPYTEPTIGNFALTYAVQAGDFNNDGNADLIGTDADTPRAAVSLSQVTQSATSAALTGVALYPLGSGTHNVDASYSGDSIYTLSLSSNIPLLAAPAPTTLTLAVSPTAATITGTPVTLTATLSPYAVGPPNTTTDGDAVKFYNGVTQIGTGTLSSGVATLTTSALPIGSDALKAVYPGDPNYLTSTSSTINVTVASILISSSANPSTYTQTVTFTATLGSGLTGSVTFNDGSTAICTATISGSTASCSTSSLGVGLHNVTGVYGGDGSHSSATSPVLVQEVDKATPTVTVTTSGPSTYGAIVTITAAVPAGTTGTVTITNGSTTLGSGTVSAGGTVTVTTSTLPVGTDTLTASYGGDGNYNPSTGTTSQTVSKASPTLPAPVVNPSGPVAGAPVTITETVPGGVSGPVTFYDGSTPIGTAPIVGGTATLTLPSLPVGTDPITASTPGDTNNNPATSPATSVTVTKNTPTVTVTTSGPSNFGSPVTITASVPAGTTGTVTFTSGGGTIGSGTVSAGGTVTVTTSTLPAGTDTITASYGGDGNNNPATGSTTQTVSKITPTVTVATSGPSTFGSPVTITASVPAGTTGTVTITSGGVTLGSGTVSAGGTVTITTSSLPVGSDTVTASYGGDSNNNPSTGSATQTVSQITPTVTVTTSGPSTYGAPVTITASVPTGTTGTITVTSGGTTLGTGTVSAGGTVTVTTSTLPVGTDTITASYGGDTNNAPATGSTTQTVSKVTPTLTLSSSSNPSTTTQPVTFTATLPTTATGTVTFSNGTTVLGTGTVVNGVATVTTTTLPAGSATITATYSGDTNTSSATGTLTQTVNKNTPVLPPPSVTPSSPDTLAPVTITETVPTGVTGPVTFYDGGSAIGTAPIVNGVASLTAPPLPAGSHPITASTPGDANNNPATSPATTVTVTKATPVLPAPVVSSSNPVTGTTVTITETVPTGVTGPVTFSNGGTVIGTAPIVGGVATITTSTLPLGPNPITASTPANAVFNAATSPATTVTVAKGPGSVTLTSSANPASLNQAVTFTAVVNTGATGTVTFYDGTTALGVGTINAGTASFTTSGLGSGTHSITAVSSGDATYTSGTSAPLSQLVGKVPTAVALSQSTNIQLLNTTVTFTANVTAPNPTPTGVVTFLDGGTAIGSAPLSTNGTATVSFSTVGNAAYATSALATGSHQITATYSGDTAFMPSVSLPVANVVADFTIAATGTTTQKLFPGDSTSYSFLVTPVGATTFLYDTTVTIAGLPVGTTYTFSPAVIASGSGPTTVTLKLTVSSAHHAANQAPPMPGSAPGSSPGSKGGLPVTLAILGLAGMGAIRRHRKQMPRLLMLLLLSVASLLPIAAVTGCAGGYFALDPTIYSLNVTGTEATIKHAATTTLVVQ